MVCTVPDSVPGVIWRRDGIVLATVLTDSCHIIKKTTESRFSFKCSGPNYMRLELNPITEDDNNKNWECHSISGEQYGNSSFIPYIKAAVEYATLHKNILNSDHTVSLTCVTGPSRPASDIWWHTADKVLSLSGVSQKDSTLEVKPNLFVVSSSIYLPVSNAPIWRRRKYLNGYFINK
ncbi:hypothetical protein KUTeg_005575 [Tegillarca granosa]|uniref:Ig-like domain-containing protein n=1 Tax=Tegillarca granosa TaxID=220873 RepID=A0ABQ9FLQ9_TEGGR|nr:hypothetical protein KUTeg_005575 [Tegillarca granosa]